MARVFTLRVGRIVNYWKTASKAIPAQITVVTDADTCTVKGSDGGTYALVDRQVMQYTKPRVANRWSPY